MTLEDSQDRVEQFVSALLDIATVCQMLGSTTGYGTAYRVQVKPALH